MILRKIDTFIDSVTMYHSALYGLSWLVVISIAFSVFGVLSYSPLAMVGSLILLVSLGFVANYVFAKLYALPFNYESSFITSLLLFFIMVVPSSVEDWVALVVASIVATVSKYVINWKGSHIFNPAAFGALVVTVAHVGLAGWWVATPALIPFTVIVSALLLRKVRKVKVFLLFILVALGLYALRGVSIQTALLSFPLIFMGAFMLTEPSTSPTNSLKQKVYATLVGGLSGSGLNFVSSPHVALSIGNIFTFIIDRHRKMKATLLKRTKLGSNIYEWTFRTDGMLMYKPGQYMEWTLRGVNIDQRGNRRTFTVVPGKERNTIRFTTRLLSRKSAYKQRLESLKVGETLLVGNAGGDFVLPAENHKSIVGIAGGIGITPFIAMLEHVDISTPMTLYYFAASKEDIVYEDVLQRAHGVHVITKVGEESLSESDKRSLKDAIVYISGPPAMVRYYKKVAKQVGAAKVKTDYFAGY